MVLGMPLQEFRDNSFALKHMRALGRRIFKKFFVTSGELHQNSANRIIALKVGGLVGDFL